MDKYRYYYMDAGIFLEKKFREEGEGSGLPKIEGEQALY